MRYDFAMACKKTSKISRWIFHPNFSFYFISNNFLNNDFFLGSNYEKHLRI